MTKSIQIFRKQKPCCYYFLDRKKQGTVEIRVMVDCSTCQTNWSSGYRVQQSETVQNSNY